MKPGPTALRESKVWSAVQMGIIINVLHHYLQAYTYAYASYNYYS